jgi:hypothetical protein
MHGALGGMAQRPDVEVDAALLEGQKFLGDEGLRQARIALYHHGHSLRACHGSQMALLGCI